MDVEPKKSIPRCYTNFYENRDKGDKCLKCSIEKMCKNESFEKLTGETLEQQEEREREFKRKEKIFTFLFLGVFVMVISGIIGIVGYAAIKFVPPFLTTVAGSFEAQIKDLQAKLYSKAPEPKISDKEPENQVSSSPAPSKSPNEVATAESGSQTTASQAQADSGLRLRRLFWLAIGALLFLDYLIGGIGLVFYGFVQMIAAGLFYFLLSVFLGWLGTSIPPIGSVAFLIFVLIWPWIAPILRPGLHRIPLFGGVFSVIDNIAMSFRR